MEWVSFLLNSALADDWQSQHQKIAELLSKGWVIQASHAVADARGLVVYYFMTST